MADANDTSKARSRRNVERHTAADLAEIIEQERTRLMQAESLLHCLLTAMDNDSSESHGPYYPGVIQMAKDMVRRSIDQLDSLRLRPTFERLSTANPVGEERMNTRPTGKDEVRDSAQVIYLP